MTKNNKTKDRVVFVGISGGVDSSVSAALLKDEGYSVVGVFIKVWQPDFLECDWEKERIDAMRVCARLGIPFVTLNLEKEYKKEVVDYMISEYRKGRTPNPDVMCNKYIKFGSFLSFAIESGADYIATGHYAQVVNEDGSFKLLQGKDSHKDQSYFLWTLTQNELGSILFPVGGFKKDKVRKLAKKYDLLTAEKKDSQGICFLGHINLEEFLGHYIDLKEGNVFNVEGEVVGIHNGAELYTMGQRHGFLIHEKNTKRKPYFVVQKNIEKNTLTVSHEKNNKDFNKKEVSLEGINWITHVPKEGKEYMARIRHLGELHTCTISGNIVTFKDSQSGLARGQSLVLYLSADIQAKQTRKTKTSKQIECLGGGIIA